MLPDRRLHYSTFNDFGLPLSPTGSDTPVPAQLCCIAALPVTFMLVTICVRLLEPQRLRLLDDDLERALLPAYLPVDGGLSTVKVVLLVPSTNPKLPVPPLACVGGLASAPASLATAAD
jgi:hypothetical protein